MGSRYDNNDGCSIVLLCIAIAIGINLLVFLINLSHPILLPLLFLLLIFLIIFKRFYWDNIKNIFLTKEQKKVIHEEKLAKEIEEENRREKEENKKILLEERRILKQELNVIYIEREMKP